MRLTLTSRRRQWQPTPVLLPGKSHGRRSLVGCSPWSCKELDMTEWLLFHTLEKEMATQSSVLAWRIIGTGEPGGLLSMGSHRVGHDWSDLAAAATLTSGNAGDPGWIPGSGRSSAEEIGYSLWYSWVSLVAQMVKNLPAMWETWVESLGWEDPLEEGEFHGWRILVGYSPWGLYSDEILNLELVLEWIKNLEAVRMRWVYFICEKNVHLVGPEDGVLWVGWCLPKFAGWSPNCPGPQNMAAWGDRAFKKLTMVKWGSTVGLIQ